MSDKDARIAAYRAETEGAATAYMDRMHQTAFGPRLTFDREDIERAYETGYVDGSLAGLKEAGSISDRVYKITGALVIAVFGLAAVVGTVLHWLL